jgi:hypothetical protein
MSFVACLGKPWLLEKIRLEINRRSFGRLISGHPRIPGGTSGLKLAILLLGEEFHGSFKV